MTFQVNSTILEACVLAILKKGDTYGYKITQEIKEQLDVSESTLYPVLRRLQKENYLETYDEAVMGRNRRYYRITDKGKACCDFYEKEWEKFSQQISLILKGGNTE